MRLSRFGSLMPSGGFSCRRIPRHLLTSGRETGWIAHDGLTVVSELSEAKLPGDPDRIGPQWHLSVSQSGERPSVAEVIRVITAFAMPAFEEDNHHPGYARHLWCPVDARYRVDCECKLSETIVVDGDYAWTTDDSLGCRGCDFEALLRTIGRHAPCPIHVVTRN